MRPDLEILKNHYLPEFQKLTSFATTLANEVDGDSFWEYFNQLVLSANDIDKVFTGFLNKYNVSTGEQIILRLERIRKEYISQLASLYCNNQTNPSIEFLLQNQNTDFSEEVAFIKDINTAIINTERQRLKKKLSFTDELLDFEIADSEITSALREIERKALKEKIKVWEKETTAKPLKIKSETTDSGVAANLKKLEPSLKIAAKKTKNIPLTYFSYAAAACFIGVMFWVGVKYSSENKSGYNLAKNKQDTTKIIRQKPEFAKVEVSQNAVPLLKESGIGYGTMDKKPILNIVVQNVQPRILSIQDFLNKPVVDTSFNQLTNNAKEELLSLKKMERAYIFNGTTLQLFSVIDSQTSNSVIELEGNKFYLKVGNTYYQLKKVDKPTELKKVTDNGIIEALERVVFDAKN